MDSSATQWTPGPWRIGTSGSMANLIEGQSGRKLDDLDDGFRTVAMFQACCASDHFIDKEVNAKANGLLIAAAPDLYDALSAIRDKVANEIKRGGGIFADSELLAIDAALAKARGEQP